MNVGSKISCYMMIVVGGIGCCVCDTVGNVVCDVRDTWREEQIQVF